MMKDSSRKRRDGGLLRLWCLGLLIFFGTNLTPLRAELAPTVASGQIGLVVAKLLEQHHYSGHPLDDAMSRQFFTNYCNALDYNHLLFLAPDIEKFKDKYLETLDDTILAADVQPAFEIFDCYSNRVEQCVATVKELLKDKYTFDGDDSIVLDRHEAPWPANEAQQKQLLRQRVKYELLEERLNKEKPEEAISIVTRRYERLLRSIHEADCDSVLEIYLNSLTQAYDPHSQYMSPPSLDNFNIDMKLSLTGIGAILSSEDGYAKIVEIVPGGPADLEKHLKVNDRIVAVAQGDGPMINVVDLRLNKVVELIRGPKNTTVRLKVIPADAPDPSTRVEIKIVRDEIKLTAQEAKAKIIEKVDDTGRTHRLGYLDLPMFYFDSKRGPHSKSSSRDVAQLLTRLNQEKIEGLVVDLRRNSGGSLVEAIALTGLFIKSGPVVQVKDTHSRVIVERDEANHLTYEGPMVVLVSHLSASAAEIFAAAMQDYGRAVIVGDQSTFGKGTVQNVVELDPFMAIKRGKTGPGALKITTQKFYRISGGSTQARGVIPDIHLPSLLDTRTIGETTLPNALSYDEVPRSDYKPWGLLTPYLPELRTRSAERLAHNPEFTYIEQDIQRLKKQMADKSISLNEAKREAEKKANQERMEARKKERLAHKTEPLKSADLTLENLDGKTNTVAALTPAVLTEAAHNSSGKKATEPAEPAPDPDFDETLAILSDYIQLLSQKVERAQN